MRGILLVFIFMILSLMTVNGKADSSKCEKESLQTSIQKFEYSNMSDSNDTNQNDAMLWTFFSAIAGGIVATLLTFILIARQKRKEHKALVLAFTSELISAFCRCVKYYKQQSKDTISYSTLFDFTDSSALAKFATVSDDPEMIAGIVELKSKYYQARRHFDAASKYIFEKSFVSDPFEEANLGNKGAYAQGAGLAFFESSYEVLERESNRLVKTALRLVPGKTTSDLSDRYQKAKEEYEELREMRKQKEEENKKNPPIISFGDKDEKRST